jgi:SAM-dependent methyltransferase
MPQSIYLRNELLANEIGRSLSTKDPIFPSRENIRKIGPMNTLGQFKELGIQSLKVLMHYTTIRPDSSVLDIGCGYGRLSIPLTRFLSQQGSYAGIDVMEHAIADCRRRISPGNDNFRFEHVDVHNGLYNNDASMAVGDALRSFGNGDFDVVFMFSVFSHMMPEDVASYLAQIRRVLKPGGQLLTTFFILNASSLAAIEGGSTRRTFSYPRDSVFLDDEKNPESAVAYPEPLLEQLLAGSGLQHDHTFYGQWSGNRWSLTGQDAVLCSVD